MKIKEKKPIRPPELCWWCLGHCKPNGRCKDCGQLYDIEKALVAKQKEANGYLDIVRQNAMRAGKDANEETRRILDLRNYGRDFKEPQFWEGVNLAITKFLKKRGHKWVYNGKEFKTRPDAKK